MSCFKATTFIVDCSLKKAFIVITMIKTIYNIKRYILNKIHGLLKNYSQLIKILSTKTTVKKNILNLILKMSASLALTLKSSRKAASLRKGDRDPCTYVWMDRKNFKRYVCFETRNGTGIWLAVFQGKVCPLGCSEKVCIPSPFLRSCQKLGGGGRSHFHVNNSLLVIPFLFFLMLHEDRFCGFVLITRWVHIC